MEGLHTKCDSAHREHTDTQQRIGHLKGELEKEKGLRIKAMGVTTELTVEVGQRRVEI
jgi:hypothetical protein